MGLLKKRDSLPKLMSELKLPTFKEIELEFSDEYCQILEPIAIALDRLQGERTCFYVDLLPTLQKEQSTFHIAFCKSAPLSSAAECSNKWI
jgi:hypothetical protein